MLGPTFILSEKGDERIESARSKIERALSDYFVDSLAAQENDALLFDTFNTVEGVTTALREKEVDLVGLEISTVPASRRYPDAALSSLHNEHGYEQDGSLVTIKVDGQDCYERFFADPSSRKPY